MTANDRLILIRVKIKRAQQHLLDLETSLTNFGHQNFHAVTTDKNPQSGEEIQKLRNHRIRPFESLSIAGDIVHNLRSALDHLTYQLILVGSNAEPDWSVTFPIAKDAATYEEIKARKIKGMRPEVIEVIDALKPYKGGNDALWRIHELDNIDKHRTLFTYANDCMLLADWLPGPFNLKARNPNFTGVDDSDVENDVEMEIDEAIREPKISQSNALLPTLHQLVNFVEDLVRAFVPHLE